MRCGQVVSVKTYELHLFTLLIVRKKKKIACHQFSLCASLHRLLSLNLNKRKMIPSSQSWVLNHIPIFGRGSKFSVWSAIFQQTHFFDNKQQTHSVMREDEIVSMVQILDLVSPKRWNHCDCCRSNLWSKPCVTIVLVCIRKQIQQV